MLKEGDRELAVVRIGVNEVARAVGQSDVQSLAVAHRRHQLLPQPLHGIGVAPLASHLLEHEALGLHHLARLVRVVRVDQLVGRRVDEQHRLAH